MSDRDRFVSASYALLNQQELPEPEKQFWLDYLLRYLKGKAAENYDLGDALDWNFTGDNIVFDGSELTVDPTYFEVDYDWKGIGSLDDTTSDTFAAVVTDNTYVYVGSSSSDYTYAVYRYTIATGKWEGIITPAQIDDGGSVARVNDMALDSSGNLYIVSENSAGIWKWDGSTVTQLAATITAGYVIGIYGNNAYVSYGTSFWHYGLVTTTVTAIGTANASITWGIDFDSSGNVYFVGGWTSISSVTVNYVAKYSGGVGGTWTALGSGLSSTCYSVAVDDANNVWVGNTVNGSEINKWNGSVWTAYNEISSVGTVYGLAYNSLTGLIVVGTMNSPAHGVFRFRDDVSSDIGDDFGDYSMYDVAIASNGDIYVVGDYSKGNIDGAYVYKYYDGSKVVGFAPEDQTLKSTDGTMAADSPILYPSQSAVRDYAPHKFIKTTNPTVNDDITLDYLPGDIWINTNG